MGIPNQQLVVDKVPSQVVCRRFSLGQSNDYHSTVSSIQTSSSQSFKDHPIPIYFSDAYLQTNMDDVANKKNKKESKKKRIFTGWWKKASRRDSATHKMMEDDESNPKRRIARRLTM